MWLGEFGCGILVGMGITFFLAALFTYVVDKETIDVDIDHDIQAFKDKTKKMFKKVFKKKKKTDKTQKPKIKKTKETKKMTKRDIKKKLQKMFKD